MNSNTAIDTQVTVLESSIIRDLEQLANIVRSQGYQCRPYSPKSLVNLRAMSLDKQSNLSKQIKSILQIVSFSSDVESTAGEHLERRYVDEALKMYDLEVENNFWKKIKKDDVIEVYSLENIQLFRTFNFFNLSGYSLLDLLTNEWYHLWERPSFVVDVLMKAVQGIATGVITTSTPITARHIVKEIYNDESLDFKCSSVLIEPVEICPLYAADTKVVKGLIFALRGQVIGYDDDSNKIAVI